MRRAAAIAIAAAVAAALATAYLARERTAAEPAGREASAPRLPDPASLPAAPARASQPVPERPHADDSVTQPAVNADASDAAPSPKELGAHGGGSLGIEVIEERFRNEPRDPTSAAALEHAILERFAARPGLNLLSLDAECRTTTCRVRIVGQPGPAGRVIEPPGPAAARAAAGAPPDGEPFDIFALGFTVIVAGPSAPAGGLLETELWLARE